MPFIIELNIFRYVMACVILIPRYTEGLRQCHFGEQLGEIQPPSLYFDWVQKREIILRQVCMVLSGLAAALSRVRL